MMFFACDACSRSFKLHIPHDVDDDLHRSRMPSLISLSPILKMIN